MKADTKNVSQSSSNIETHTGADIPAPSAVAWMIALCACSAVSAASALEATTVLMQPSAIANASLSDGAQDLSTRASLRQRSIHYSRSESSSQGPITWSGSYGPLHLLDEPSDYAPGQPVFRKPRVELRFNAPTLRHTLLNVGVDAQRCTAPIVKFRGKLFNSGATQVRGTMWVMARCSIW